MAFRGAHDIDARNSTFNQVHGNQTIDVTHVHNYYNTIYNGIYTDSSSRGAVTDDSLIQRSSVLQAHPALEASDLRSLMGGESTYVIFVNTLDVATTIYWINFTGEKQHYYTLPPGESYRQQTFVHHPWLVCTGSEQSPLAVFHPLQKSGLALIDASLLGRGAASESDLEPLPASTCESDLRSLAGGESTFITFVNALDVPAHIYWKNYTGERVFYTTLAPHTSYQQQTFVHHPWVVCTGSQHAPIVMFQPAPTERRAVICAHIHDDNAASHSSDLRTLTPAPIEHPDPSRCYIM